MGYRITTAKGYEFFECSSAFQKAIRRGDEKVALYFMCELYNSGYDEYVWKRTKVVVSEDVGLAEPTMPATIHALYTTYSELKKKGDNKKSERLMLVHAVILLCRCKKSRLVDWVSVGLWRKHADEMMEIPDYAYDVHNMKGKRMGRDVRHFYYEGGAHLENHEIADGEIEAREAAFALHQKYPSVPWDKLNAKNKPPKDADLENDNSAPQLFS